MGHINSKQFFSQVDFYTNITISFFNLCSDLFSNIAKKINQIRNRVVRVLARFVVSCCAFTTSR